MDNHQMMEHYVTADELLAKQYELGWDLTSKCPFYSWESHVWASTILENLTVEENDIPWANLQKHIKLSIMKTGVDVQKIANNLLNERETLVKLPEERRKIRREALCRKEQLDNMKNISSVLQHIEEQRSLGTLTSDRLVQSFLNLQRLYIEEYKRYNLSRIACSYVVPLFSQIFKGWDPLQNPIHGQKEVSAWKTLLEGEDSDNSSHMGSPYSQLVLGCVYPAVYSFGANSWTAKDPNPMLRFLDLWKNLLPPPVVQKILDTIVMPKIAIVVNSWDPRMETIDVVHSLILPWQHLLGDRFSACWNSVCVRLSEYLKFGK